jgi:hypothetical protein
MRRLTAFLCITLLSVLFFSKSIVAADVSVGVSSWYTTWIMTGKDSNNNKNKTTMGPEIMIGPAVSVQLAKEWALSSVVLVSSKYDMPQGESDGTLKLTRTDSDTTLNYSINKYFKIFPGIKFMRFSYTNGFHQSAGPGFGCGVTLPILESLFFITNGSGSYLFGRHKDGGEGGSTVGMHEYGYNITAGLAYYIESISTTVSLGYRYQYFHTKYTDTTTQSDLDHVFRGFTASIVYSF